MSAGRFERANTRPVTGESIPAGCGGLTAWWQRGGILVLFLAAGALRFVMTRHGANWDMQSWVIVGKLAASGENFYELTSRYNYGPIFAWCCGGLWNVASWWAPLVPMNPHWAFRLEMTGLLSVVDMATAGLLYRRIGFKGGLIFLLNPLSILISGYHGQFDNLALLFGLVGVELLERAESSDGWRYWMLSSLMLGVSLATKHLLFLFPLWIALRTGLDWRRRLATFLLPFGLFSIAFVPYASAWKEIFSNVIAYRSVKNAPLWNVVLPDAVLNAVPAAWFTVVVLMAFGWLFRRRTAFEGFLGYLGALVTFAPAMVNQYLAIPCVLIAVRPNLFFALFVISSTWYLVGDVFGLRMADQLPWYPWEKDFRTASYLRNFDAITVLFACGFLWTLKSWFQASQEKASCMAISAESDENDAQVKQPGAIQGGEC
jgi:hypothetical protein